MYSTDEKTVLNGGDGIPKSLLPIVSPQHRIAVELARIIAAAVFILTTIWMTVYEGGLSWSTATVFNLHPFAMTLGPVMCGTWAAVMYRSLPATKTISKTAHATFNLAAVGLIGLALAAVITDKLKTGAPQFKSAHSWVGLTTICLFTVQIFAGLTVFVLKPTSQMYREWIKPYHAGLGVWTIISACVSACLGALETQSDDQEEYNSTNTSIQYILPNAIVLLLLFLIGTLLYVLMSPRRSLEIVAGMAQGNIKQMNVVNTSSDYYGRAQTSEVPGATAYNSPQPSYSSGTPVVIEHTSMYSNGTTV